MFSRPIVLLIILSIITFFKFSLFADATLLLKDNLKQAQPGDYIVISANKTDTLMHMREKKDNVLTIEEIAVPEGKRKTHASTWKEWVQNHAPDNTSWVMYDVDLQTGQMLRYYSFSKQGWFEIPEADNFLYKLLNLKFTKISEKARKRVGPKTNGPDFRPLWQPRMIVNGQVIKDVAFDAWRAQWPKDNSDLSSKIIEVYLPQDSQRYPSYFPYWLQISGAVGKAKIRIIDSGHHMQSPKPSLSSLAVRPSV